MTRPAGIALIAMGQSEAVSPARSPVVVVLAAVLLLRFWLMQSDVHLLAAVRLGELIGPSPLPGLSREQLGKIASLAGVAMLCGGAILIALQWPQKPADRPLAKLCMVLLGLGGSLTTTVDLAPTVWPSLIDRELARLAELTVQCLVPGGCAALVASRLACPGFGQSGRRRGRVAPASARAGSHLATRADQGSRGQGRQLSLPGAIDACRHGRIDGQPAFADLVAATHAVSVVARVQSPDGRLELPHLALPLVVGGQRHGLAWIASIRDSRPTVV